MATGVGIHLSCPSNKESHFWDSVLPPPTFAGARAPEGAEEMGKSSGKKDEMPLPSPESSLLFAALVFWSSRFAWKDQPGPGGGRLSLRVWQLE